MSLRRIRIQELGVIEDAELDLADGLNVITGETGAGKTMVVSGLGLLLGERADTGLVRSGSRRAVVEGEVEVAPDHPASRRVAEAGGDVEDGLVLVRTVAAEGRSRASLGGRSAPVSVLAEVGQHLVAVHGQADQWRLRDADQHRILVDAAGGQELQEALARYRDAWERWQQERSRLLRLTSSAAQRSVRVSVLRAGLEEIQAVDPHEGEEDELRTESERLSHSEELRNAAQHSHDVLAGAELEDPDRPSVAALLSSALAVLGPAGEHDPELAQLRERAQELSYLTSDLASDLAGYAATIDIDPARLEAVHARRAELIGLLRRYGPGTREVLTFAREAAEELERIDVSDVALGQLQEEVERLRQQTGRLGAELTEVRQALAEHIGAAVTEELAHLAMGSARVSVAVEQRLGKQEPTAAHGPAGVPATKGSTVSAGGATPTPPTDPRRRSPCPLARRRSLRRTGWTRSRSGWPPTPGQRLGRSPARPPGASCPGSCWPWSWSAAWGLAAAACPPTSSMRSTQVSAALRPSTWVRGSPGWLSTPRWSW
ncbi:DNA repair protein RecN [Ornithinimicrobium pratense]|uniref:DNA repair protein RecN n=1 Tax=Ornithinimicrobium pratense TaxID=2593973 RepID=A0A5J6V6Q1_9MICO|nr:AAA family ATPase [Ornithinimicrobium pratense]